MRSETPEPLKLIALDQDDLKILSAHLQDAVLRLSEMAYVPSKQRFAAILTASTGWPPRAGGRGRRHAPMPLRAAVRPGEAGSGAEHPAGRGGGFAELLAVTYEEAEPPSGTSRSVSRAAARCGLRSNASKAELRDLGVAWKTAIKPQHAVAEAEPAPAPAKVGADSN